MKIFCGIVGIGLGVGIYIEIRTEPIQFDDGQQVAHWNSETIITFIESEGIGRIAVQVQLPKTPRYSDGAPVVVYAPTFFTNGSGGFASLSGLMDLGFIQISFLYPGREGPEGIKSEGDNDYGGADSIQAFRDVMRFVSGKLEDENGHRLDELLSIVPDYGNVGIFAFSHPGIAATAVLAEYGEFLSSVSYFVGRENPTEDLISAVEIGHFEFDENKPKQEDWLVYNPFYNYPEDYSSTELNMDYASIQWDSQENKPYFDVNGNGTIDQEDYLLGDRIPQIFGKYCYSAKLTQALLDNGVFTLDSWPNALATPEESQTWWKIRESIFYYSLLKKSMPDLKVMLVFGEKDHVQTAWDKPHIHQAYDGFHETAGLWIRLNPDASYVALLSEEMAENYVEHDANTEPEDWADIKSWAYPTVALVVNSAEAGNFSSLAALAEMADRTHMKNWEDDLIF